MRTPPLGIFLDVDGPVSSPETRTVAAALLDDVRALLAAGVPVALNTGRSTDFAAEHVLRPLVAAGLPPASRLHAICEKGGSWMTAGPDGLGEVRGPTRRSRCPRSVRDLLEALVRDGYDDAMFVDRTKVVMATVEARTDVPNDVYAQRQRDFDADLLAGLTALGLGVRLRDERVPGRRRTHPVAHRPLGDRHRRRVGRVGQGPGRRSGTGPVRRGRTAPPASGTPSATRARTTPWPTTCTGSATR